MVTLAAAALRSSVSTTLDRVAFQNERVMIQRNGKSIAGLVSADDLELLEAMETRADLKAVRAALKEGGARTPWRELKKELGL